MTVDLPLPNYDDLPTNAIGSRARPLDAQGVRTLLEYEQAHANRPVVVQVPQARVDELENGAQQTGGVALRTGS